MQPICLVLPDLFQDRLAKLREHAAHVACGHPLDISYSIRAGTGDVVAPGLLARGLNAFGSCAGDGRWNP